VCGIAGIWGTSLGSDVASDYVEQMLRAMQHRGPDGQGVHAWSGGAAGMVRLALVDLSQKGQQPIWSSDGKVAILFNGEMYTHTASRRALDGYPFRSTTDTEVVLALYLRHGLDFVRHLRGMYALAILDHRGRPEGAEPMLVLARDPLGIKPLYLVEPAGPHGPLHYSSELRPLVAAGALDGALDDEALYDYLSFGFVLQPRTILRGARMLRRGSLLVRDGRRRDERRFWSLKRPEWSPADSFDAKAEELRGLLDESVRLHALADAPVGAFLSGGVDSSVVVGLMSKHTPQLKTFTIKLEDRAADETALARDFARRLGCDHTEVEVRTSQLAPAFERFGAGLDQPSTDGFNTWLVSREAARSVKAVLSGLGGDEWFAGYPVVHRMVTLDGRARGRALHLVGRLASQLSAYVPDRLARRADDFAARSSAVDLWAHAHRVFTPRSIEALGVKTTTPNAASRLRLAMGEDLASDDPVDLACELDVFAYMGSQLLRDSDVTSMAHSLELRVPLVDVEIARFARSCPSAFKLDERFVPKAKRILVHAVRDVLPADIGARPKRGFALPYAEWLRGPLAELHAAGVETARRLGLDVSPPVEAQAFPHGWALTTFGTWARSLEAAKVRRPLRAVS